MPTLPGAVQQVITDAKVDMSLTMTAQMFGLSKETVTRIVQTGLPLMAQMAETNPELLKRMYAATLATMPEPLHDFYVRMVENPTVRQAAMDDYRATYGAMLDTVNREAARQAGITDGQARDVFAAALPALTMVLGLANADGNQQTFAAGLQSLYA